MSLLMKRKYVFEITLLHLNFTFIHYFSDADIEIFDGIRKSFNAKLIAGTLTTIDEEKFPGVSSGTFLKIKLPTLSVTEFWIRQQKDYNEPSEKIPFATSLCCKECYIQFVLYTTNSYQM